MKKREWIHGNKMKMESGHKTFDRQTNVISTGNCIANTQMSFYIRGKNCTECNGMTFAPGYLQQKDLENFSKLHRKVRETILEAGVPVILYHFFHANSHGPVMVSHGWVITDTNHNLKRIFVTGPTYKSLDVVTECVKYVAN